MKHTFRLSAALLLALVLSACSNFSEAPLQGELGVQHQEHPDLQLGGVTDDGHDDHVHYNPYDPNAALEAHDAAVEDIVSGGPDGKKIKNLALVGRGDRLVPDATTDVWALDGYAYIGTFSEPCGTGANYEAGVEEVALVDNVAAPGIAIFNVKNQNKPSYVGNLPSLEGSRVNDVKIFTASDGTDILVHSNEPCAGGPGGFDLYDVSDPKNPVHLSHVTTGDINPLVLDLFGTVDEGVHNLYLFSRDGRDYVAAQVEGVFDNFQIFDITDPTAAELVSSWGAEELFDPGVGEETTDVDRVLDAYFWLIDGYGASQNRFLHDFWVADDGTLAYLANWDAGLVRLDISNFDNPEVVSVALALDSEDGEVNSHSVWPSENGRVVVEGEEDFAPFKLQLFIDEGLLGIFDGAEAGFTPTVNDSLGAFDGETVYVGLACTVSDAVPAGDGDDVAVVQRGTCRFDEKVQNIQDAGGYTAVIIFNNLAGGDVVLAPGGADRDLPTVFVGYSTGLAIFGLTPDTADQLTIGMTGESAVPESVADGWSGFRIWDYSNPENPILASTFNTVCSANPLADECDPRGTYSSHNVIVENQGNKVYAYFSWYTDGLIVVDVTNPYNPIEIARYDESGAAFEAQNGGIQDIWGVYKEPNSPFIYGSDRNGGLYIFKMLGKGTIGKK